MAASKKTHPEVDTPTKNRIIGYAKATGNAAEAGRKENVPERTAQRIVARYRQQGTTANKPRPGRPRKCTPRDIREIERIARKKRRAPFKEIANEITVDISESTVRRELARKGYHRRVAKKVPYLTPKHKKKRLAWACSKRLMKRIDWWRKIFSDECYVYLGDRHGRIFVTRRPDEKYDKDCLVPTFKQSSVRIMVWGCIMDGRKGPLVVLEYPGGRGGGMNSARYQEQVLDKVLKPFYTQMNHQRSCVSFQQDGAPSHTSKSTKQWFAKNGIPLFDHPPSSPDLNPIEPLWHDFKNIIRSFSPLPTTVPQLISAAKIAWEKISVATISRHVGQMEARVQAILEAKGGHTRF